jgi:protein NrfC
MLSIGHLSCRKPIASGKEEQEMSEEDKEEPRQLSRRKFLKGGGLIVGGAAAAIAGGTSLLVSREVARAEAPCTVPSSQGYLVVDSKKCSGCASCMLACSMVHEKKASLSLSRIQIVQTPLAPFPFDLDIHQCRQCASPLCIQNCPTGAQHVDAAHGNVRTVDTSKCVGCGACLTACPHPAHRTIWNHVAEKAMKCDLCIDTPYWKEKGGPGGKQACVAACPMEALKVVTKLPDQTDTWEYDVNLRKG